MQRTKIEITLRKSWAEFYRGWKAAKRDKPCTGLSKLWKAGYKHYKTNWPKDLQLQENI